MSYSALEIKKLSEQLGRSASVLDFPIERQKEIAQSEGYDDYQVWREDTQKMINQLKNRPLHIFDSVEEAEQAGFVVPNWQKDND